MTPTFTTFDRRAAPLNLLTVQEWRRLSNATWNGVSWMTAARKYAAIKGGALVWRADDSLVVFTLRACGAVSRKTYKPGTWRWAA